jgi:uncharacterized RDD family membrane protein YckC
MTKLVMLALGALISVPGAARAQTVEFEPGRGQPALRIGQDYTLKADDVAREVLVIAGDATIEGRVDRDVVVILGKAQLASTAVVEGSLVVVGGTVSAADGARVREDLFVLGGFDAPASFSAGGHHVVIGTTALGGRLRGIVPWLTRGLLWGRPIVPDLPWVWTVAMVFFLINLGLNLVFDTPVRACAATLRATPLSAFMVGLLVLLLTGPLCVLLAVSVVGIAVVPFVICALLLAAVLGRIGFARWIGMSVARQEELENRALSFRSFLIGSAIMCAAYMIPVLGFVTWTLAGVFGIGSAALAFSSAYRRENPKPPRAARTATPAPPFPSSIVAPQPVLRTDAAPEGTSQQVPAPDTGAQFAAEGSQDQSRGADVRTEGAPPAASDLLLFPRAPFSIRLAAFVLDFVLILIVASVLGLDHGGDGPPFERVSLLLSLAYHVGFWTWKGTTLGGIICQLRVVRIDGAPLRFAEALVRGLTGIFSLAVLGLGFLWVLRDPERQAWHDRVAGTYVVRVPRNWPI